MTPTQLRQFLTAGAAVFTLANPASGVHFTYRISRKPSTRGPGDVTFISWKRTHDFEYLGLLGDIDGVIAVTRKSPSDPAALKALNALQWALRLTWKGQALPAPADLKHMGLCGRCGRPLTHPESIDLGLGPDCAAMMGVQ